MYSLFTPIRKVLRYYGFDFIRYDTTNIDTLYKFLTLYDIHTVLDVGANEGQFAKRIRREGYTKTILSFEPASGPFKRLLVNSKYDNKWECYNFAFGDEQGQASLNITELEVYSSFLQPTSFLKSIDPRSRIERRETVELKTIDDFIDNLPVKPVRILLKIDTQGFEKQILLGAQKYIKYFIGIQIEMSLKRTYVDQLSIGDMIPFMQEFGFELFAIWNCFSDPFTAQILEVDGLFINQNYIN